MLGIALVLSRFDGGGSGEALLMRVGEASTAPISWLAARAAVLVVIGVTLLAVMPGCGGTRSHRVGSAGPIDGPIAPTAAGTPGATLDAWHGAAAAGEAGVYFGLMTADAVFIGTDATERWSRDAFMAYSEPYFGVPAGEGAVSRYRPAWVYVPVSRDVVVDRGGGVAWFDELLENEKYGVARGTGVLRKTSRGGWRIAQYSLSFPIPNAIAKDVTQRIRSHASGRRHPGG
ncbi:MAG: nuclear transport factor 2 family protein [Planctomycetota bacterium]